LIIAGERYAVEDEERKKESRDPHPGSFSWQIPGCRRTRIKDPPEGEGRGGKKGDRREKWRRGVRPAHL